MLVKNFYEYVIMGDRVPIFLNWQQQKAHCKLKYYKILSLSSFSIYVSKYIEVQLVNKFHRIKEKNLEFFPKTFTKLN